MSPRTQCYGRAGLASAAATVLALAGASAPVSAVAPAMTLSSVTGPSGGGNTIIATAAGSANVFPAGITPTVQFQYFGTGATSCSPSAQAVTPIAASGATTTAGVQTVDPATVKRITTGKLAFEVPSRSYPAFDADGVSAEINPEGLALIGSQTSAKWNVCVYDNDTPSSRLLASASYTLVVRPSITSVTPLSSPTSGGRSITVTGTGFSAVGTTISGTIGGTPLTGITVSANGDSLTALTAPRAAGDGLPLLLNTPGGRVSSLDPDNNGRPEDGDPATADAPITFEYTNEITNVEPGAAPLGSTVTLDVFGADFSKLTFSQGGDPTSSDAHVFLVDGAYDPAGNRGVAECNVLMVVSDTELICTLDLSAGRLSPLDSAPMPNTPISEGAYVVTVVADGRIDAGPAAKPTIGAGGEDFTVLPPLPSENGASESAE